MADLGIDLLDTGTGFTLVAKDIAPDMKYGEFALALINTDYDKMLSTTTDFLRNSYGLIVAEDLQNIPMFEGKTLTDEIANMILRPLFNDLASIIGEAYLDRGQRELIALLLLIEMRSKITAGKIDLATPASYIPNIFSDRGLNHYVRDILLKKSTSFKSPITDRIAQMQISSSVIPVESADKGIEIFTTYHLTDSLTYLFLDLQKYVSSSRQLKECQCCGRLFYPQFRQSEKYCRLPHKDTPLLCNEIKHNSPNDEFVKARNRARAYQKSRVDAPSTQKQYDGNFLLQLYDDWSNECGIKFVEYKNRDDLQGFIDWIARTKFTAKELKRLWAEYQANGFALNSASAQD